MSEEVKKKKKRKKYKKRKIKKEPKKRVYNKHTHQIVLLNNNKQVEFIGSYPSETKANKAFNQLINESNKVIFPIETNNTKDKILLPSRYEIAIIKRREENDPKVTVIRNDMGDFIEQTTTSENWVIYDKKPYKKEESFWVYGYHPLVQRKDFLFIFNSIVKPKAITKGDMLNVMVFKNKVLFETLYGELDMVICKTKSDAIRLYNLLEEWCKKDKEVKYYLFNGDWSKSIERMVEKIQKLTNWDKVKITRNSTRP
jgi:hypothetical protein